MNTSRPVRLRSVVEGSSGYFSPTIIRVAGTEVDGVVCGLCVPPVKLLPSAADSHLSSHLSPALPSAGVVRRWRGGNRAGTKHKTSMSATGVEKRDSIKRRVSIENG